MNFDNVKFDIILLAGQSNAQGSGYGPLVEEHLPDGVLYRMSGLGKGDGYIEGRWHLSLPVDVTIEEVDSREKYDFAVSFAREYRRRGFLAEDRKLLILHTALGATSFMAEQWTPMGLCYRRMLYLLDCALNLNPENRVVAMLWHQGESDASRGATEQMHYENLCYLFENTRKRVGNNIPIITADFCADWKSENAEACAPIVAAIRRATEAFGGVFIETADLPSNAQDKADPEDHIHFSRKSLEILGKRYFEAFNTIRSK